MLKFLNVKSRVINGEFTIEILNTKFIKKIENDPYFCVSVQLYSVELIFSIEIAVNETSYSKVNIIG